MKYIKTFENYNIGIPEVGDWVICEQSSVFADITEFISNNIGRIIDFESKSKIEQYVVKYYNAKMIPFNDGFTRNIRIKEIKYWSNNKEDLEPYILANKYNI